MLAPGIAQHPAAVGIAELDQPGEPGERRLEVASLLGHDDDPEIVPVGGERDAKTVDDAPARRRQEAQIDAVLVGEDGVAVLFEDLQLVEATAEQRGEHALTAREQRRAAGEQLLALGFAGHRPACL